jgi:hypothetical protein
MITSRIFGYADSYKSADTIEPAKGYWVKVDQAGELLLSSTSTVKNPNRIRIIDSKDVPPPPPEESAAGNNLPTRLKLEQNYPNPFNPSTIIRFSLPKAAFASLKIYNILGQEITTLLNKRMSAGVQEVTWNASAWPGGVYLYRLLVHPDAVGAGSFSESKKLVLLK